eukprot:1437379-Amphidinium_carterae.1
MASMRSRSPLAGRQRDDIHAQEHPGGEAVRRYPCTRTPPGGEAVRRHPSTRTPPGGEAAAER